MTSLADHLAEYSPHGVHYETRCKYTMSALAITAPLVFIGTICAIVTVLYSINEEVMIFTDSQEAETSYCTRVQYVHLLNGVCTRGVAVGIDVEASCIQWDDSDRWKELDETNAIRVERGLTNYTKSDFESEAAEMWPLLGYFSIIAVIFAGINLIVSVAALDTDYLYTKLGITDVDYFVLTSSCFCTSVILAFIGYTINNVYYSDVANGDMWYTEECTTASSPTLGAYVLCMGGLFTWISWGSSFYSYMYIYIYEDTIMDWYHTRKERREVQDAQDAMDAQDNMEKAQREANHRRDQKPINESSETNNNTNNDNSNRNAVVHKEGGNMYQSLGADHDSDSSSLSTHSSSEDSDGNENGSVKLRVPGTPRDSPIKSPVKPKKPPKPSSTSKHSAIKGTPGSVGESIAEPKGKGKGKGKGGDKKEDKERGVVKDSKKDDSAKDTGKKSTKPKAKKATESTGETTPTADKKPPTKPPKPSTSKDAKDGDDPLKAIIDAHTLEMTTKGKHTRDDDSASSEDAPKPSSKPATASKKKKKKVPPKDANDDKKDEEQSVVRVAEKTEEETSSPGKKSQKKAVIRVTVADSDSDSSSSSGSSKD